MVQIYFPIKSNHFIVEHTLSTLPLLKVAAASPLSFSLDCLIPLIPGCIQHLTIPFYSNTSFVHISISLRLDFCATRHEIKYFLINLIQQQIEQLSLWEMRVCRTEFMSVDGGINYTGLLANNRVKIAIIQWEWYWYWY